VAPDDPTDSWPIAPMKAVPGELPTGGDWMHEPKWDGHRALVRVHGQEVEVASSNGKPRLASWPWITEVRACLTADDVIVDGEVVAMDDAGKHSFGYIGDPTKAHALILFDILRLGGEGLLGRSWLERRAVLEQVFTPAGRCSITPVSADGNLLWDVVVSSGYEGIVSKRVDSTYLPGKRAPTWRKVKWRHMQEFVVGGWSPGAGRREGTLGSLLLGVHDETGALQYVGGVGSGFDDQGLREATERLRPLATTTCPFTPVPPRIVSSKARWCRPECVVQVEYGEWTSGGQLRHPVFVGFRDDVDPLEVTARP
jgi:bifunctional non-homologous end joining protein LigD